MNRQKPVKRTEYLHFTSKKTYPYRQLQVRQTALKQDIL